MCFESHPLKSILGGSVSVASELRGSDGDKSLKTAWHTSPRSLCSETRDLPKTQRTVGRRQLANRKPWSRALRLSCCRGPGLSASEDL